MKKVSKKEALIASLMAKKVSAPVKHGDCVGAGHCGGSF